jgi:phasin family protein
MLDKFFEQTQNAMRPMNELASINTKAMEQLFDKQKALFNDMWNDGMNFAKELSSQKDFSGVYQTQKAYLESVQERLMSASTDAYEIFTNTQEKASDVLKSSVPTS